MVLLACAGLLGISHRVKGQVKDLFRLNKQLQEENYYMADFEFKMLGIGYLLDKGRFLEAVLMINRFHRQLETREGLVLIPNFGCPEEELNF